MFPSTPFALSLSKGCPFLSAREEGAGLRQAQPERKREGSMTVWQERLDHLKAVIQADVAKGAYYGAVLKIGRHGELVFDEAIGAGDGEGARPLKPEQRLQHLLDHQGLHQHPGAARDRAGPLRADHEDRRRDPRIHRPAARQGHLLPPSHAHHRHARRLAAQARHVPRPARRIAGRRDRGRPRQCRARHPLRLFAARQSCADGRGAAPHGCRGPRPSATSSARICSSRSA